MKKLIIFLASSISLLLFVLLSCSKAEKQEAMPSTPPAVIHEDAAPEGEPGNLKVGTRSCLSTEATCDITITLVSGTFNITVCGISTNTGNTCALSNACNITAGPYRDTFTTSPASFCASPNRPIVVTNNDSNSVTITIDVNGFTSLNITISGSSSEAFMLPADCDDTVDPC